MRRWQTLLLAGVWAGAALAGGFLLGNVLAARVVLAAGILGELVLWGAAAWKRERELEELIGYLTRLQDQPMLPRMEKSREGNLGILESEIYKLVIQLSERSDLADREQRYLADMLSNISHQIKTPLTAITIMTDLLKEPEVTPERRMQFAGKIDSQAGRITWLIQTLLTLSRLEARVLTLKRERISPLELVERARQPLEILAELKGVELVTDGKKEDTLEDADQPDLVCDIHWTGEALSNIIKNCIEHTPGGGRVELAVSQNNFSTNIRISDNGEGISSRDLPHIFERFYKAEGSGRDSAGIGLALARQIVMMQNGIIDVESCEGRGTVFTVKFYRTGRADEATDKKVR